MKRGSAGVCSRKEGPNRTEEQKLNLVLDHDTVLKNLVRRMGEISHVNMVEDAGVKAVLSLRLYVIW